MDSDEHLALGKVDFAPAEHDTERQPELLECRTRHMVGGLLHS